MKGLPLHRWENAALIFHLIRSPITFSSSQAVVSSFSGSHWDLLNLSKLVSKIPLFLSRRLKELQSSSLLVSIH